MSTAPTVCNNARQVSPTSNAERQARPAASFTDMEASPARLYSAPVKHVSHGYRHSSRPVPAKCKTAQAYLAAMSKWRKEHEELDTTSTTCSSASSCSGDSEEVSFVIEEANVSFDVEMEQSQNAVVEETNVCFTDERDQSQTTLCANGESQVDLASPNEKVWSSMEHVQGHRCRLKVQLDAMEMHFNFAVEQKMKKAMMDWGLPLDGIVEDTERLEVVSAAGERCLLEFADELLGLDSMIEVSFEVKTKPINAKIKRVMFDLP